MLYFAGRKVEQAYVALLGGDSALDDVDFPLSGDGLGLNFLHELDQDISTRIKLKLHEKGVCKPSEELHLVSTWLDVMFLWMQLEYKPRALHNRSPCLFVGSCYVEVR